MQWCFGRYLIPNDIPLCVPTCEKLSRGVSPTQCSFDSEPDVLWFWRSFTDGEILWPGIGGPSVPFECPSIAPVPTQSPDRRGVHAPLFLLRTIGLRVTDHSVE